MEPLLARIIQEYASFVFKESTRLHSQPAQRPRVSPVEQGITQLPCPASVIMTAASAGEANTRLQWLLPLRALVPRALRAPILRTLPGLQWNLVSYAQLENTQVFWLPLHRINVSHAQLAHIRAQLAQVCALSVTQENIHRPLEQAKHQNAHPVLWALTLPLLEPVCPVLA